MKSKIILLIGAVALVTLSFTFAQVGAPTPKAASTVDYSNGSEPVGGFVSLEITK